MTHYIANSTAQDATRAVNLTSTPESINGNEDTSPFVPPQPSPQYPIYREGTGDGGTAPNHIRGGQNAFQSTSSLSRSNGVGGSGPSHSRDSTAAHRSAPSLPALTVSAGLPATRTPELLTLHLRSSDQPITGSTRYTVWENVIEMPRNVPYPSLSNMRYTITPHSRMSQVDIPDEDGENEYDGDDDNEIADDAAEGSSDV
ncbi:hypothetical protein DL93DRAFT_1476758 [Clavulina sp. PMI_390]|nr:hypothetical protein DL93DRAFT_1476758 [Clavulina sp. PMI_390]